MQFEEVEGDLPAEKDLPFYLQPHMRSALVPAGLTILLAALSLLLYSTVPHHVINHFLSLQLLQSTMLLTQDADVPIDVHSRCTFWGDLDAYLPRDSDLKYSA